MKKFLTALLIFILCAGSLTCYSSGDYYSTAEIKPEVGIYFINGNVYTFDPDELPYIDEETGLTMVSPRFFANILGCGTEKTGTESVSFVFGDKKYSFYSDYDFKLLFPDRSDSFRRIRTVSKNNTVFLPLRKAAEEFFKAQIIWNGEDNFITVKSLDGNYLGVNVDYSINDDKLDINYTITNNSDFETEIGINSPDDLVVIIADKNTGEKLSTSVYQRKSGVSGYENVIVKPGYSQKWSKRVNLGSIDRELQPGKKYIVSVHPQTLVVPAFWANTLYQKSFEITF